MDRLEAALSERVRKPVRRVLKLILIASICLFAIQESKAIFLWYSIRQTIREEPNLRLLPKPLRDSSVQTAKDTTTISLSGCSLDLPWTNGKSKTPGVVYFPDGSGVLWLKSLDAAAMYRSPPYVQAMTRVLGPDAIRSNYSLTAAELNANPADLTFLTTLPGMARLFLLLEFKSFLVHGEPGAAVFTVTMGQVRGFQIGDPELRPNRIRLQMFDSKDRQFNVLIPPPKGSGHQLTQPEINFITGSMRCDDGT